MSECVTMLNYIHSNKDWLAKLVSSRVVQICHSNIYEGLNQGFNPLSTRSQQPSSNYDALLLAFIQHDKLYINIIYDNYFDVMVIIIMSIIIIVMNIIMNNFMNIIMNNIWIILILWIMI